MENIGPPDFSSIILFFSTIALQHLGVIKNPVTDKVEKNLSLAKYTIDTIDLLKEKTKGNLTGEEEKLLTSTIADLKLAYVRAEGGEKK
jgi:hypothetical protein